MFICMHMDIAHAHMHWTIGHTMFRFLSYSFFIEKIYKQLFQILRFVGDVVDDHSLT